jgi:hypothetical protein
MEFRIDSDIHLVALAVKVNRSIAQGWQPQGQPFHDSDSRNWCQAMTHQNGAKNSAVLNLKEKSSKR